MQNRGILITLRAAAIVIIVTGLNDVLASAIPRYEPLYLYLAAVALVALTDGVVLGLVAAFLAIAFYGLLFMPRADALSMKLAIPAGSAVAVAVAGGVLRAFVRSRRRKPAPVFQEQRPPLLETSVIAQLTDNADVLRSIDELRTELRTALAELNEVRTKEADRPRHQAADLDASDVRIRHFEKDREWALKVAEEGRNRADREREMRIDAERQLEEAQRETAALAARVTQLELSVQDGEQIQTEAAELATILEETRRALATTREELKTNQAALAQTERDLADARHEAATQAGRVAELELSLRETEQTQTEAAELAALLEETRRELAGSREQQLNVQTALAETERQLAEARQETATMAGRVAELELSVRETEKAQAEVTRLRNGLSEADRLLAEERSTREQLEQRVGASNEQSRSELSDLRTALDEARRALTESRALQRKTETEAAAAASAHRQVVEERDRHLAEERALRERLEQEVRDHDKKLQTIVTHLASDHEADLGQALSDKEEARAEVRAISLKLANLQRKHDEEAVRLHDAETLLAETRAAAQGEIDRLRAELSRVSATPVARPRVMIVHPDADLRATASASLERAGYDVVSAADGLEALRVAIARQPDVVIAETSMPKMDGRELCQLLKSQEKTAHIRVVLLMRASDEIPRGELPPDQILRKPVPVETLKATLASLLASGTH